VRAEVIKFLCPKSDTNLSITNDIELLATASSHPFKSDDIIVLVAGTGSIAMRYRREGDACRRVARAGGWGALLGDDGSGFDIGRQAIRAVLRQTEERVCSGGQDAELPDPLASIVCEHFRPTGAEAGDANLLSNVLLSASGDEQSASQAKQRIASCAKAVVDAAINSKRAESIVSDAIDSLAGLIRIIYKMAGPSGRTPLLVLAGGLMKSDSIQHRLVNKLGVEALVFSSIERVDNPAFIGARYLAKKQWSSNGIV
jgi:N-acetylmuramic acid 6-phosphate etherase